MDYQRRAVIDVGTNSVKLLVAETAGRDIRPVLEQSKQTRLGHGFYAAHRLQPQPIADTAKAVQEFALRARQLEAQFTRVIATSAARDATNGGELIAAVREASGLETEIVSGEQEAEWAFRGVTTQPELAHEPLLLAEVGGGSTQLILGEGEHLHFRQSFRVGTVRLMDRHPHSDPPRAEELAACLEWLRSFLRHEVRPRLEPALVREAGDGGTPILLIGTGGTSTILGRMEAELEDYDRARLEATRLSRERLLWHLHRLWGLPLEERRKIVGLPPNRADVILTGVAIFVALMEEFGFGELRISTRGLRFGAVAAT